MTEQAKKRKDEAAEGSQPDEAMGEGAGEPLAEGADAGGQAGEPGETVVDESADLATQLEQERQRTAEMKEKFVRMLADVENVRRRHERELEDTKKYAITSFAREMLDVADNLNRALQSVPQSEREQASEFMKNLLTGIEMTEKSLHEIFERHQIRRIEPEIGEKFDPNRHQAMFEVPNDELPKGSVAQVMQVGYGIADRTLRPALVGVAKSAGRSEAQGKAQGAEAAGGDSGEAQAGDGGETPGGSVDTSA